MASSNSGQSHYSTGSMLELEGLTDTKPVHLPQIKKVEFESLLKVMYPQLWEILLSNPVKQLNWLWVYSLHSAPLSEKLVKSLVRKEWIHVLNLSTKWGLDDVSTIHLG